MFQDVLEWIYSGFLPSPQEALEVWRGYTPDETTGDHVWFEFYPNGRGVKVTLRVEWGTFDVAILRGISNEDYSLDDHTQLKKYYVNNGIAHGCFFEDVYAIASEVQALK